MRYLISAMLVIVGVIHLLPASGILSADRLTALYGISFSDPGLVILMRHRAVLFGLLGGFLLVAAFQPRLRTLAFIAASSVRVRSSGSRGRSAATTRKLRVYSWPTSLRWRV